MDSRKHGTKRGKDKTSTTNRQTKKRPAKAKVSNSGCIEKHYSKSKSLCKVTFRLPKEAVQGARNVTIVGDFNNWNVTQTPMKQMSNGDYTLTLELPCNREFNFRYLVDAEKWEKDWFADRYIPDDSSDDNSLIST